MRFSAEVAVGLDGRPGVPVLRADDPLFARGDGVFETMLLRDGRVALLDAHLDRLADSAAVVGLPAPDRATWLGATRRALARWGGDGEAVVRLVHGRGAGGPSSFVTVSEVPERVRGARADGVTVLTVDRGLPSTRPGWSLAHAKSSSYAVSIAALRHVAREGCDDALFVSTDGFVLEGPRSTVLACVDGVLVTPPASMPILPGITGRAVFSVARQHGVRCLEAMLRPADLLSAQGVWLLSSITLAARVRALDGTSLHDGKSPVDVPALLDEALAREP